MEKTYGVEGDNLVDFAIEGGLVPSNIIVNGRLQNHFGGGIDIISRGELLEISYDSLLFEDCLNMVARTGQGVGIVMIRIGVGAEPMELPLGYDIAEEMCYDGSEVAWYFFK